MKKHIINPHRLEIVKGDGTKWPFRCLSDRWGSPDALCTAAESAVVTMLVPKMYGEMTFVYHHPEFGYGLLFEVEFLHSGSADEALHVKEAWAGVEKKKVMTPRRAFAWIHEKFIVPALDRWPKLMIWCSQGNHVWASRIGLYIFIPMGSPLMRSRKAIGQHLTPWKSHGT